MSGTTTQQVGALITQALVRVGAVAQNETPSAADTNGAMVYLNQMLAAWNARRWLVYVLQDVAFVSTGAQSYTIGSGAQFDTPRPDKILSAFMRLTTAESGYPVDYPLNIIQAREDYNRIMLKTLANFPNSVFYEADYPVGTLFFWPIPSPSVYELHVTVKAPLTQFTGLTQTIDLPPEYQEALLYNLCLRLYAAYGASPDPVTAALAEASLGAIRASNAQVPLMGMPAVNSNSSWYNPYSGTAT